MAERKHIGILLFADVEELDAVGPREVLSWTKNFPEDGYDVSCRSRQGGQVRCAKGWTVLAHPAGRAPALSCTTKCSSTGCGGNVTASRS